MQVSTRCKQRDRHLRTLHKIVKEDILDFKVTISVWEHVA